MEVRIRAEGATDAPRIEAVTVAAFSNAPHTSHTEHRIVDALRAAGQLSVSLVAEADGIVVGHVAVSPVSVSDGTTGWFGLGPVSVLPGHQRLGIGSQLMHEALGTLRKLYASGCVVLGDPAFYGRFGFVADPDLILAGIPPEYFQVLSFNGARPRGTVTYHAAFDAQDAASLLRSEKQTPFSGRHEYQQRVLPMRKVAFVTGATRGIGKACALSLARAGYDIVVTGRTVKEGDGKVPSASAKDPRDLPVPGSIESTVAAVRGLGREALGLQLDILSRPSIDQALDTALATWGRVDVLVNNAIYQGPGLMYRFTEFTQEQLDAALLGTLVNQVYITRRLLPTMIAQGGGTVFCIGSVAGLGPPPVSPAKGGWGFLYGASKSAFHRLAEFLHVEHRDDGIRSFLVEPQMTVTDTMAKVFGEQIRGLVAAGRAFTPEVTGDVVAWLATHPEADAHAGKLLSTPTFFKEHGIAAPR